MREEIANDPVLRPVVEALAQLPPRQPALVARILEATARPAPRPWWGAWRWPALALVGAAVLVVALRTAPDADGARRLPTVAATGAPSPAASPLDRPVDPLARPATTDGALPSTVPVQFVFEAPGATSVHVTGDFAGWQPLASPLERDGPSGLWTATLWLTPGRHVYAFVVDGTRWMADPAAPRAPDDDFGQPGSVLLVRAP
jgi:hypothetical protein